VTRFCWMDLKTRDVPGAAAFFSTAMGWHFAVDEDDWRKATKIAANGYQIGSVSDLANPVYPPGSPAHIAYYLAVDDVDRRTEAATANGARLVLPPFEAGDQGRMATLIDPVGAAFSLWQPDRFGGWECPATWLLIREFGHRFAAAPGTGRIIRLASDHTVGNLPYGASKGALDRIILAAAHELAHLGISADVINPGPVDTGWMSDVIRTSGIRQTPLGRLGTPQDAANLVDFLRSSRGQWINGQLLLSNGGFA
jgi:predicted enzyme related to lactoylglutathione lyase